MYLIICLFFFSRFQVPELKPGGHMMDVRTADGSVVKISAGNEQDLAKTLGVEMVQNMYKVNILIVQQKCNKKNLRIFFFRKVKLNFQIFF